METVRIRYLATFSTKILKFIIADKFQPIFGGRVLESTIILRRLALAFDKTKELNNLHELFEITAEKKQILNIINCHRGPFFKFPGDPRVFQRHICVIPLSRIFLDLFPKQVPCKISPTRAPKIPIPHQSKIRDFLSILTLYRQFPHSDQIQLYPNTINIDFLRILTTLDNFRRHIGQCPTFDL
jgi:hypothetical protein